MLLVSGSAGSNDAMDIFAVLKQLKKENVVVNVLSLLGTMHLWHMLAQETGGRVFHSTTQHALETALLVLSSGLR